MINGILIGIGGMVALGMLVSFADREGREVLLRALATIVLTPVIPFYYGLRWLLDRKGFQVRAFSNRTLQRFVTSGAFVGVVVHRRGRAYLVITDPKVWRKGSDVSSVEGDKP